MNRQAKVKDIDILLANLIKKLPSSTASNLKKIIDDKPEDRKLLKFLLKIYHDSKKSYINICKDIFISLAKTEEEAALIVEKLSEFLNNPGELIRLTTIDIIYDIYYEKFKPSMKLSRKLGVDLIDCLAFSIEVSPDVDLLKGYNLLKSLAGNFPEEIIPLIYRVFKLPSHPCDLSFMELIGDIKFDGFLWIDRLSPYIMDIFSGDDEELIIVTLNTMKRLFPHSPELLSKFINPLTVLLNHENEDIQIAASEVICEISLLNIKILMDLIPLLADYIRDKSKSQKAAIIIGKVINNLSHCSDRELKKVIKKSNIKYISDRQELWNKVAINILEQAMINQQRFTIKEFIWLFGNDIFKEILGKLILNLQGDRGSFLGIYYEKNWLTAEGKVRFAHTKQMFTISHPLDIFFANQITLWQKLIMERKIKQPFHQVFRSLYSLHMDEITSIESLRFSRHKLIPTKAISAFKEEGFTINDNYAYYNWKDNHIQTQFVWDSGHTGEKGIAFTGPIGFLRIIDLTKNLTGNKKIPLWQIEPRIFSETIRKLEKIISLSIFRKSLY